MINQTKIKIPKKYEAMINLVDKDDDGYWAYAEDGYYFPEMGCQTAHEDTQNDLLKMIRTIKAESTVENTEVKRYACDMNKNGEIEKVQEMKKVQRNLEETAYLIGVFMTRGYDKKYDVIRMCRRKEEFEVEQGYIFYDSHQEKPVFILDRDLK